MVMIRINERRERAAIEREWANDMFRMLRVEEYCLLQPPALRRVLRMMLSLIMLPIWVAALLLAHVRGFVVSLPRAVRRVVDLLHRRALGMVCGLVAMGAPRPMGYVEATNGEWSSDTFGEFVFASKALCGLTTVPWRRLHCYLASTLCHDIMVCRRL